MAYFNQGTYDCILLGQGFAESKEKGTPFLFIRFMPVRVDGQDLPEEYERELKLYLTTKTIERTVEQLRGLGWEGESFKELEPGGSFSFKGVNASIRCLHEQNGEKIYEKWELPYTGGFAETESVKGLGKRLDGLFGKELKTTAKVVKAAKANPENAKPKVDKQAETVPPDDEIPF